MWFLIKFGTTLIIIWSSFLLLYPEHRFLMVLFCAGALYFSDLLINKIETAIRKDKEYPQKDMRLIAVCFLGASMSLAISVHRLFSEPRPLFSLLTGITLGTAASLPVLWGIAKKGKKAEFYLRMWTVDWPSIQIIMTGTLFSTLGIAGSILMIISIEAGLGPVMDTAFAILASVFAFFISSTIEIKIIECAYKKKFWLGLKTQ